ncbi:MAG TPA: hypothetical protein VN604_10630 [Nitrospirota bacterium]|nr:hypothetical protein [Nitrospirota bacterium]
MTAPKRYKLIANPPARAKSVMTREMEDRASPRRAVGFAMSL